METVQAVVNEDERKWNQWIANAVGALLTAAPHLSAPPGREKIKSGITAFIEQSLNGKTASLARLLGVSGTKLMSWQRGLHLPGFENFLRLCKQMDVPPLQFLTKDADILLFDSRQSSLTHLLKERSKLSIEEVQQRLEGVLKSKAHPFLSLKEVAWQLNYPVPVLQHLFPELCDAISQRYQQQLDPDSQRKSLDALLVDPEIPFPSLSEVARRLGCPVTLLKYRFPDQCREIAKRSGKTLDLTNIQLALDAILSNSDEPPPSIREVLSRLGCSRSTLYLRFLEACHAITKRHQGWLRSQCVKKEAAVKERLTPEETEGFSKALDTGPIDFATSRPDVKPSSALPGRKLVDIDQLKLDLEMVLVTDDEPPPTLTEVAKRLGYSCSTLYRYFPELCRAIAKRHKGISDIDELRRELEVVLANEEEPYPSLQKVIERLRCPGTTLRRYFPAHCRAIIQRHRNGLDKNSNPGMFPTIKDVDEKNRLKNAKDTTVQQQQRVVDIDGLRSALEVVLKGEESPPPTMVEVARRLGISSTALYHYFPQQCRAIAEQHKRGTRKIIDDLGQALEKVLMSDKAPFPTVQEVAKNLGCPDSTLYRCFPDLCHAIAKRHQLDRDHMRQLLQSILAGSDCPPSVSETARRLRCSASTLTEYFPEECEEIKERHWKIADASRQRQALEAVLADGEQIPCSINEIARQLGCSSSTLYNRFPELCQEITKRRWRMSDTDHLRRALEAALVENPPPSLENVAKRLGCSSKNIQYYFPDLARAITRRRRDVPDRGSQQKELEGILASNEHPLSLEEVARRLGTSSGSLRKRFPEVCATISARYMAFRKSKHEERIKRICDEVRRATLSIHSRGDYPSKTLVGALLRYPACFKMPEVRDAWRATMQELGYKL